MSTGRAGVNSFARLANNVRMNSHLRGVHGGLKATRLMPKVTA
jgi:hypothetical protein